MDRMPPLITRVCKVHKQTTGRKHYDHGHQAAPPGTRRSPSFSILVNHGCRVLVWAGAGAGGTREQARRPNARQTTLSSGASARGGVRSYQP